MTTDPNPPTSLTLKIVPCARKTGIVGTMSDGALKVRIAAVPEDGKANTELCRYLGEVYSGEWTVIA